MVNTIIRYAMEVFAGNPDMEDKLKQVEELEDRIDVEERNIQDRHVERLAKNECTPEAGMLFSDIISGLERVADHATNIAFAIRDSEREDLSVRQVAVK